MGKKKYIYQIYENRCDGDTKYADTLKDARRIRRMMKNSSSSFVELEKAELPSEITSDNLMSALRGRPRDFLGWVSVDG